MKKKSSKRLLRRFKAIVSCANNETIYLFSAYVVCSSPKIYKIIVDSKSFKDGVINVSSINTLYFYDYDLLNHEMDYHFYLLSQNCFTIEITEIKK